ncbi:MAG TPA: c-type cytochrome biogenesis protein CcsB [Dissulfurispiraceae bacterium]|nr:c-type cytochrome biogenesis protein CcsB [Dissulfurispiraceae bacterium]
MDSSFFFGVATIAYILAMVAYIVYLAFRHATIGIIATTATVAGFVSQTIAFGMRWNEFAAIGHLGFLRSIPLTNLYESLVFFVWCLILGYLVIEWKYKTRSFGAFITPIAGMVLAFISIGGVSAEIHPLVPALQSNWLLAHVTMSFLAYAAFAISYATAIMYLAVTADDRKSVIYLFWTVTLALFAASIIAMGIDFVSLRITAKSPEAFIQNYLFKATFRSSSGAVVVMSSAALAAFVFFVWRYGYLLKKLITSFSLTSDTLDDLTYKSIAIGFPIFTLGGLIFGAIWADQAWGKYWSWDPKETWSLITWFVYAFYIHARHIRGWRGRKIAVLAVIGFVCTIFTYLGVNLLLSGLHSYGSGGM